MSSQLSVVVGRFQVPSLSLGHCRLLDEARKNADHVLILVGSAGKPPSVSNPLDFNLREHMLRQACPSATILPVFDHPDDKQWMKNVEELTNGLAKAQKLTDVVYYSDAKGFVKYCWPSTGHVVVVTARAWEKRGTTIRQDVKVVNHPDFRSGVICGPLCGLRRPGS